MYYIILIFSLLFGCIVKYKYGRQIYCFTLFLLFFLVSGLRYDVGYDYFPYMGTFYRSYLQDSYVYFQSPVEKGYLVLNELISNFTKDYQWLFIVIAFLVAASVMWFIYKYSKNVWLSSFVFIAFGCFYFSMDYLRQIIAGIIMLYGFKALDNDDYSKYLLYVLFASCFHKSALLLLPMLLVLKMPMTKYTVAFLSIATMGCFLFSENLIQWVLDKGYYSVYALTNVHMTTGIPLVYGLVTSTIFLLAFALRKKCICYHSINRILIPIAFLNAFFTLMGAKHSIISRFTVLLEIPVMIILLVDCILISMEFIKSKQVKIGIFVVFILIGFGYHYYLEINNYNGVFPYKINGSDNYV